MKVNMNIYHQIASNLVKFAQGYKKQIKMLYANVLENGMVKTSVVNPTDLIGDINLVSVFVKLYIC